MHKTLTALLLLCSVTAPAQASQLRAHLRLHFNRQAPRQTNRGSLLRTNTRYYLNQKGPEQTKVSSPLRTNVRYYLNQKGPDLDLVK